MKFLLATLLIFTTIFVKAQNCVSDTLYFTSQGQVDSFPINYPGCTVIQGSVYVVNNDNITNFDSLRQLTQVQGNFHLFNLSALTSLSGLEQLNFIGDRLNISDIPNITTLEPLSNLTTIGGYLRIVDCANLTNLNGLENLTTVGSDFLVSENENLLTLSGIQNLTSVGSGFSVAQNPALVSIAQTNEDLTFEGLGISHCPLLTTIDLAPTVTEMSQNIHIHNNASLTTITGLDSLRIVRASLNISNCPQVSDISALTNLREVGGNLWLSDVQITDMQVLSNLESVNMQTGSSFSSFGIDLVLPSLQSLSGLENLRQMAGRLQISRTDITTLSPLENMDFSEVGRIRIIINSLLTECSVNNFCNFINLHPTMVEIYANGDGCDAPEEVLENCDDIFSVLPYVMFFDTNTNGQLDTNELRFTDAGIIVESDNGVASTSLQSSQSEGLIYLAAGQHLVRYDQQRTPNWELTTDTDSLTYNVTGPLPQDTIFYGVQPNAIISNLFTYADAPQIKCNESGIYQLSVKNAGTTSATGTLWFELGENLSVHNFTDLPDTMDMTTEPVRYGWYFTDLPPTHRFDRFIELQYPGPPDFTIGDSISTNTFASYTDLTGAQETDIFTRQIMVLCAYDPNDKLVHPGRADHFTLFEKPMFYTIRFQNTGNAPASVVRIEDQLSDHLDLTTFRVMGSSHESVLSTTLTGDGLVNFTFTDIELPDSTTNLAGSQGFVSYFIRAKTGLVEGTEIDNTAGIYFDLNPPIITNTTKNILASDNDADGYFSIVDCDDENAAVFPGAAEIPNNQIDEDCDGMDLVMNNTDDIAPFSFRYHPNPAADYLQIFTDLPLPCPYEILGMDGRVINSGRIATAEQTITLPLLPNGLYYLKMSTDQEVFLTRILILQNR